MLKKVSSNTQFTEKVTDITFEPVQKFDQLPAPGQTGPSAFISIMEGCSKFCSFCIVPYTRGPEISRPVADILLEVTQLIALGAKEIHLLGQNVNNYRAEFNGLNFNLADLIRVISTMDGVARIKFTTSHPAVFDQTLIDAYADLEKLPDYLHLPVQSGSDRILMDMKRGYSQLDYRLIIKKLREARPNISISSDFIVGYPGETEADFNQTLQLVQQLNIDHSYSFIYSPRPGTPAAYKEDNVTLEEKKVRLKILQDAINSNAQKISHAMLGSCQETLVLSKSSKVEGQLTGKTSNNRTINFLGDPNLIGQMIDLKVTKVLRNSLIGELIV